MVLGLDCVLFEEEVMDLWLCQQRRRHLTIERRSKWLWKPPLLMKPKEIWWSGCWIWMRKVEKLRSVVLRERIVIYRSKEIWSRRSRNWYLNVRIRRNHISIPTNATIITLEELRFIGERRSKAFCNGHEFLMWWRWG